MEIPKLQTTFTANLRTLYKKAIILLTFLAYSLTLVHSLVPHRHNNEARVGHHHHGSDEHHHHHHNDKDDHDKSINSLLADAIHNPASEVFVSAQAVGVQKKNNTDAILIVKLNELLVPELKPPDRAFTYQDKYHSSNPDSFFLLRAPPVA
jgi:Ca2+/H+ antiporter